MVIYGELGEGMMIIIFRLFVKNVEKKTKMNLKTTLIYTMKDFAYLLNNKHEKRKLYLTYLYFKFCIKALLFPNKKSERLFYNKIIFNDYATFVFLFREIFIRQEYEINMYEERPLIIDCGANIGMAALFFKYLYEDADLYCFEPLPENNRCLDYNLKDFNRVYIEKFAIGDKVKDIKFYYNKGNGLQASAKRNFQQEEITVRQLSLSWYLKEFKRISLLKLDIEGSEFEVMEDLAKSKRLKIIDRLVIEVHHNKKGSKSLARLLEILEKNDFQYYIDSSLTPLEHHQDMLVIAYTNRIRMHPEL
jgi:FkbM family methyltransferase